MNLVKLSFIGLSVVAIAATQACGSSSDTTAATGGTTNTAGTTGNAGTPNGGATNGGATNGGDGNNEGGADNNGGDGNNEGGADNNGGAGNDTPDGGGSIDNPAACPAEAPETGFGGDSCSEDDLACSYPGQDCTCNVFGGGGGPGGGDDGGANGVWQCEDAPLECPATAPTDGDDCEGEGGFQGCDYEGTSCTCQGGGGGGNQTWNCDVALVCPATQPADGDACEGGGFGDDCPYGDVTCFCFNEEWNCPDFGGGDGGFQFP